MYTYYNDLEERIKKIKSGFVNSYVDTSDHTFEPNEVNNLIIFASQKLKQTNRKFLVPRTNRFVHLLSSIVVTLLYNFLKFLNLLQKKTKLGEKLKTQAPPQ